MKNEWEQSVLASDAEAILDQIRLGAMLDSRDRHGQTALMIAATRGDVSLTKLLIDNGADLNVTAKYHLTALMLAVLNDHEEIVRLLCDAGANLAITGTGAPALTATQPSIWLSEPGAVE
jgi:ankyrin repeat protein